MGLFIKPGEGPKKPQNPFLRSKATQKQESRWMGGIDRNDPVHLGSRRGDHLHPGLGAACFNHAPAQKVADGQRRHLSNEVNLASKADESARQLAGTDASTSVHDMSPETSGEAGDAITGPSRPTQEAITARAGGLVAVHRPNEREGQCIR
jgi:hypothetical protein